MYLAYSTDDDLPYETENALFAYISLLNLLKLDFDFHFPFLL